MSSQLKEVAWPEPIPPTRSRPTLAHAQREHFGERRGHSWGRASLAPTAPPSGSLTRQATAWAALVVDGGSRAEPSGSPTDAPAGAGPVGSRPRAVRADSARADTQRSPSCGRGNAG